MVSDREHATRDSYHTLALALELLAYVHNGGPCALCVECAQRCAERLFNCALAADYDRGRYTELNNAVKTTMHEPGGRP